LRALKWSDVDLKGRMIRVERTLDDGERAKPGETIAPKTKAGRRRAPVPKVLHGALVAHKLRTGRDGGALVFGRTATAPFIPSRSDAAPWPRGSRGTARRSDTSRSGCTRRATHSPRP